MTEELGREDGSATLRVLHCHSTFSAGTKELRSVELINAFGTNLEHTIVSGDPAQMGAADHIDRAAKVRFSSEFPALAGFPSPGRLVAIAQVLKSYDLVLTYNWGAIDVAMAHTVFGPTYDLPPLIHHEDGFPADEADRLKPSRNFYRRIALQRAMRLVVPSRTLQHLAQRFWPQPRDRVVRIPNGIDTKAFVRAPNPQAIRVVKRDGEFWVGTLAELQSANQLTKLVQASAQLPDNWHLVIVGDGPEKDAILAKAADLEIAHRVHLTGAIEDPAELIGLFDIFALASHSEAFPQSVIQAMAAGLPIAAPDFGDIKTMIAEQNQPHISVGGDPTALGSMLEELAARPQLRGEIGEANRAKAQKLFDRAGMIERYRTLYSAAVGRDL